MDQEELNRRRSQADGGWDSRPITPEEMRARNARRQRPELDSSPEGPRRKRRTGPGANGNPGGNDSGPRRKRTSARRSGPKADTARQKSPQKKERTRTRREEIHWTDPKPFIRKTFVIKLAAALAVTLAVFFGFSVFFKVRNISVSGMEKYTPEAVLSASGIQRGDSLLSLGKAQKAGNILSGLPYVKEVQIGIKLPDTVNINIVELDVTYSISDSEGRWWLMDSGCKLVEGVSADEAAQHTKVTGLVIQNPQIGQTAEPMEEKLPEPADTAATGEAGAEPSETEASSEPQPVVTSPQSLTGSQISKLEAVSRILQALEKNNLMGEIQFVDVTFLYNITLQYGQRFSVWLGGPEELEEKVDYMAQAVQQLQDYEIGVLDVTFEDEKQVRFIPAEAEEPQGE